MTDVVLYHVPPSFYSQIARIALWELGISFEGRVVVPGPPGFETYRPWYMRLNPMGTVPTLLHGDHSVGDSNLIVRYAVETLSTAKLVPEDAAENEAMEYWIEALRGLPVRELSYGSPKLKGIGARVNASRVKHLNRHRAKNPDLSEVYDNKLKDIQGLASDAQDEGLYQKNRDDALARLDEMNRTLGERTWLAGSTYSLADAVWTVGVARMFMVGLDPREGRPALASWYARVKARPSFKQADVWEGPKPWSVIKAMAGKHRGKLIAATGLAGAAALACWVLCG